MPTRGFQPRRGRAEPEKEVSNLGDKEASCSCPEEEERILDRERKWAVRRGEWCAQSIMASLSCGVPFDREGAAPRTKPARALAVSRHVSGVSPP
jgi:hypothetical protein